MRNLRVTPLDVEELRLMTHGMTADQMNALADTRANERARPQPKPMPKRTPKAAGRGTAQPGMVRMVTGAYPKAAPPTPFQNTQEASESTTAGVDAQSAAVALAAIQLGLTAAMGALAGENNPADHTANAIRRAYEAQNIQLHGQSDDDEAPPGADVLSDGIPSDYGPGHED